VKKNFQLRNDLDLVECLDAIKHIPINDGKPFQVSIVEGQALRSLLQNKLYWKHISEIEAEVFDTKNNIHYGLKRRHLHPIFMAGDTGKNLVYQTNYAAMCLIKESGVNIDFEILHNKMLSTTDCTVKQMSQYIESYWPEQNKRGIQLTDPDTFMGGAK
jgi:hypothetical protein